MIGLYLRNTFGGAVVEFALALPLFLLLFAGLVNFGMIIAKKNELTGVVSVGMLYAFGNSSTPSEVQAAMTNASNLTPLTVTVTQVCHCLNGTLPGCGVLCVDGMLAAKYVSITANTNVNVIGLGLILPDPFPITVQGIIRVP